MPSWQNTPIHVIDFEGSRSSGILEFGIVTLFEGQITETQSSLCRPTGHIAAREFEQHGISSAEAKPYPPFSEHWDLFSSLRKSGVMAAHHASVEDGLIRSVWPCPSLSPDFQNPGQQIASWGPWIDSCKLAQRSLPDLDSYKLSDLIVKLGISEPLQSIAEAPCPAKRNRYHCALYDSIAAALIILDLLENKQASITWLMAEAAMNEEARAKGQQPELF